LQIRAAVQMPLAYLGGVKSWENIEIAMASGFGSMDIAKLARLIKASGG